MADQIKLNIGSGGKDLPGFTPWDIRDGHPGYPLPQADGSVAEIYASHVLEHFPGGQVLAVLADWFRALTPGGRLRVAVPDFDRIVEAYIIKDRSAPIAGWLHGGQTGPNDIHYCSFNRSTLQQLLSDAGFERIATWKAELDDCAALPVSLNLEGYKPASVAAGTPPTDWDAFRIRFQGQLVTIGKRAGLLEPRRGGPVQKAKTAAVWTTPRLGFMATFGCIYSALPPLGIPLVRTLGAFWGQSMETCMERALEDYDPEYLVTLDFDSLFTQADLVAEISIMDAHPEIGALCPFQWHRTERKPLWTPLRNDDGTFHDFTAADLAGELYEVGTAHFGLTLIRTSALRAMPHPWFIGCPAPDGTWSHGKLDDDMHFWLKFRHYGNRVFLAPQIAIGHEYEGIVWPGRDLEKPVDQGMYDYLGRGKPEGVFGGH